TNQDLTEKSIRVTSFPERNGMILGGIGQGFAIGQNAPPVTAQALTELLTGDEFVKALAANDILPALPGYAQYVRDPVGRKMAAMIANGSSMTLDNDQ